MPETLKAKAGSDYLYGDAGDDLLKGGGGTDASRCNRVSTTIQQFLL